MKNKKLSFTQKLRKDKEIIKPEDIKQNTTKEEMTQENMNQNNEKKTTNPTHTKHNPTTTHRYGNKP